MSRRTKIFGVVGCLVFACSVACVFNWKELRIAYHKNRALAAGENYQLVDLKPGKTISNIDGLKIIMLRISQRSELEAMEYHRNALFKLVFLERREFHLTNRVFTDWSDVWPELNKGITNTFNSERWDVFFFPQPDRFVVTDQPANLPKWEKIIRDIDR